jgi:ElaB/YqjD/DUF883 family membrane-anchored ribosome-binding protein
MSESSTFNTQDSQSQSDAAIRRAADVAHQTVDRAVSLASSMKDTVHRSASGAHESVDRAAAAAKSAKDRLYDSGNQFADDLRAYASNQPLKAMGIALVAGIIVGRLIA